MNPQADEAVKHLRRLLAYLDDGTLVRDTSRDAEMDWMHRMIRFVGDIAYAKKFSDEYGATCPHCGVPATGMNSDSEECLHNPERKQS